MSESPVFEVWRTEYDSEGWPARMNPVQAFATKEEADDYLRGLWRYRDAFGCVTFEIKVRLAQTNGDAA